MFVEKSWIDKAPESYRDMLTWYESLETLFERLAKHLECEWLQHQPSLRFHLYRKRENG